MWAPRVERAAPGGLALARRRERFGIGVQQKKRDRYEWGYHAGAAWASKKMDAYLHNMPRFWFLIETRYRSMQADGVAGDTYAAGYAAALREVMR